jgi:hypothetical protein
MQDPARPEYDPQRIEGFPPNWRILQMASRLFVFADDVRRILDVLHTSTFRRYGAMTAREIATACGEHQRTSRWANKTLRDMARLGLVRPVGSTLQNARTWAITDAGRAVATGRQHSSTGLPSWWHALEAEFQGTRPFDLEQREAESIRNH